ncbi:MAG: hypothetical protein P1S60_05400, partial [Anaerolineae bacterium]|nr:hypothetical protein [Anaerolineae bacterium]
MQRTFKIAVWVIVTTVLWVVPIFAQDILEISPSQLIFNSIRNRTVSRALLIRANQEITDLHIIALDLEDAEGNKILPAGAIQITGITDTLDSNGMLTINILINLQDVSSGQYTGDLLVSFSEGTRQVPLTVMVKDEPYLPAIVLIAGVGLGLIVSEYRSKGKPRDEILVNLGQIRTQIKVDQELKKQGEIFFEAIL